VSQRLNYPDCRISTLSALICIPPSEDWVEVLIVESLRSSLPRNTHEDPNLVRPQPDLESKPY
jgi:hypothetical protein